MNEASSQNHTRSRIQSLALVMVVAILYGKTTTFGFLRWDDNEYVTQNALVQGGLSWPGVQTAFTTFQYCDYHPLTMLSLMVDRTLFGRWAGGFHLTSIVLHAANVVLLFNVIRRLVPGHMTGFLVALLFAIHPLHVESVAWVSERKDVLSIFFGLLVIRSYLRFVQEARRSSYLASIVYFAGSLFSKGTLVTLPCVLLLIDVWPLQRFLLRPEEAAVPKHGIGHVSAIQSVIEKIPFFSLSLIYGVVLMRAQTVSMVSLPLSVRWANAIQSDGQYLRNLFCPLWLNPFYPHPGLAVSWGNVVIAGSLLVAVTAYAAITFRRRPGLAVGWLWFLGTLIPMLGVVAQVGEQAMADRYAYFPAIGVYLAMVCVVTECSATWSRTLRMTVALSVFVPLFLISMRQVSFWETDRALWSRALQLAPDNPMAHLNLGAQEDRDGNPKLAEQHFEQAVRRWPNHSAALHRLAIVRMNQDRLSEARDLIDRALRSKNASPLSRVVLGMILEKQKDDAAAKEEFARALAIEPNLPVAHVELAKVFEHRSEIDDAIHHYEEALRLAPRYSEAKQRLEELRGRRP
ncbi:MAG: hypothetical protein FD138_125 [Planctomycetota bacterium]|nr:MAG: hypothetical protein FD138_125 [Planctomycetota bacterium]